MDLSSISKSDLKDDRGLSYREFVRGLRPNRLRLFFDLAIGMLALLTTAWLGSIGLDRLPNWWLAIALLASASFGYWIAYLQLFIHEGAHFNLAADRGWNDRICDCLIGIWSGVRVKEYRVIHWDHHRFHGQVEDSEHTYFMALNGRFLFESLFGVKALKVLLSRRRRLPAGSRCGRGFVCCSILLHLIVLCSLWFWGHWSLAAAWAGGVLMFFPLFGALRQLLEHRSSDARKDADYFRISHGKTTRMFSEGLFASTFGAAGFTRHLLHHWDPSIAYTNLGEVERFLRRCAISSGFPHTGKTTYLRAFLELYGR